MHSLLLSSTALEHSLPDMAFLKFFTLTMVHNSSAMSTEPSQTHSFYHTQSAPYCPKGNGRAEAEVKVAKSKLKKSPDIHAAPLNYRNTPQQGHIHSPAQKMISRRTSTTLPTNRAALAPRMISLSSTKSHIMQYLICQRDIHSYTLRTPNNTAYPV